MYFYDYERILNSVQESIYIKQLIFENQRIPGFQKLADHLIEHPEFISELVDVATSEWEYPYPQYASWLLFHVARKDKTLVEPFYNQVIDCILSTKNTSVLRSLLGVSLCFPLTDYQEGNLLDRLFILLNDPDSKPGLINYTVKKLAGFLDMYPELLQEIESILEFREEVNLNPGIVAWSKMVLKKKKKGQSGNTF